MNSQPPTSAGSSQRERLADDLLFGARAIAEELGMSVDNIYYIARTRKLPIGRLGKNLIASRRRLKAAAHALTADAS
jgi:hypothetical protein